MVCLILYISLALLRFIFFMILISSSVWTCLSSKSGRSLGSFSCSMCSSILIDLLVLWPIVIKKSLSALAISTGSVCVLFS